MELKLTSLVLALLFALPVYSFDLSQIKDRMHNEIESFRPSDDYSFDCTPGQFADEASIKQVLAAQKAVDDIPVKKIFNGDPDEYLVFVVTDGTEKDAGPIFGLDEGALDAHLMSMKMTREECQITHHRSVKERLTKLHSNQHGMGMTEHFPSNPAILAWLVQPSDHVRVVYVRGVGSDPAVSIKENLINAVTGDTLPNQINEAYGKVQAEIDSVRATNPRSHFVFVTTGFSRGAAAARALNNRILRDGFSGIKPVDAHIGASLLFDTVITQTGVPERSRQIINPREFDISNDISQVLHITAKNEYRMGFELLSAHGRNVHEILMPGSHSDIGGGYGFSGIPMASLNMSMKYLARAGVPMKALPSEYNNSEMVIHDSRTLPRMAFDRQLMARRVGY